METEKLYYADPFLTDFTATVLDCQPGKNGYLVTLDRTAFYPEGGGQPADHGVLDRSTGSGGSTTCSSTPESISVPG